jgi:hypothetical protein
MAKRKRKKGGVLTSLGGFAIFSCAPKGKRRKQPLPTKTSALARLFR